MKLLIYMLPLLMIGACKTTQTDSVITNTNTMEETINKNSGCPDDGTCGIEVYKNKKLTILDDGTGSLYPEMIEGDAMVVEYTYFREGPEGTVDGNYSETIHFEIPQAATNLKKENAALADVNLYYGKHCFCKGEAGYYPVTDGKLLVDVSEEGLVFDLIFNVNKTSQVVRHISEMIKFD